MHAIVNVSERRDPDGVAGAALLPPESRGRESAGYHGELRRSVSQLLLARLHGDQACGSGLHEGHSAEFLACRWDTRECGAAGDGEDEFADE